MHREYAIGSENRGGNGGLDGECDATIFEGTTVWCQGTDMTLDNIVQVIFASPDIAWIAHVLTYLLNPQGICLSRVYE